MADATLKLPKNTGQPIDSESLKQSLSIEKSFLRVLLRKKIYVRDIPTINRDGLFLVVEMFFALKILLQLKDLELIWEYRVT